MLSPPILKVASEEYRIPLAQLSQVARSGRSEEALARENCSSCVNAHFKEGKAAGLPADRECEGDSRLDLRQLPRHYVVLRG